MELCRNKHNSKQIPGIPPSSCSAQLFTHERAVSSWALPRVPQIEKGNQPSVPNAKAKAKPYGRCAQRCKHMDCLPWCEGAVSPSMCGSKLVRRSGRNMVSSDGR